MSVKAGAAATFLLAVVGVGVTTAAGNLRTPQVAVADASEAGACVNARPGWLSDERSLVGTDLPTRTRSFGPARGYVADPTVRCGDTVEVHLAAPQGGQATVDVVRVGDYSGRPLRVVHHFPDVAVPHLPTQPAAYDVTTRTVTDPAYPSALQFPITEGTVPGMYLVRVLLPGQNPTYIPFWVRATGPRPGALAMASVLTAQAYNVFGGASLYRRVEGKAQSTAERADDRAYHVGVNRPYVDLGHLGASEIPLARMVDRAGIEADWTTDVDYDANPAIGARRSVIVLPGHSEYWSTAMYDALVRQVDDGTNLLNFGANEIYWRTRVARRDDGSPDLMTVFRLRETDPDLLDSTIQWRVLGRSAAALTGQGMRGVSVIGDGTVTRNGQAWLYAGTGLSAGSRLPGLYQNETNSIDATYGQIPANIETLLVGQARAIGSGAPVGRVTTTYYSRKGGAGVFNAGTTFWLCTAFATCPSGYRDGVSAADWARTPPAVSVMSINVLKAFAAAPGFGTMHGSARNLSPGIATPAPEDTEIAPENNTPTETG